jgi:flagellar protein FliL
LGPMKDDDKDMSTPAAAPAPVKKSKLTMILVLVGGLLVLGGGAAAGGYWWMARNGAAAANGEKHEEDKDKIGPESGIIPLEQFTVNLADKESSRFLRATVHLVIDQGHAAGELKEDALKLMRIRSSILELLTVQTSDKVTSPEGKAALKEEIGKRASAILKPVKVIDVLFSDFVVQF